MIVKNYCKNWIRFILIWSLFSFQYVFCAEIPAQVKNSAKVIEHFLLTNDTTDICFALNTFSRHFEEIKDPETLKLLLKAAKKEEKLDGNALKILYLTIRRFYEKEDTKIKNFEYSFKVYKILSKSNDYEGLMWILMDIGNIYFSELDFEQASAFYHKAEQAAFRADHNYGLSVIYLNYGLIEERKKDYQKALENYKISSHYRMLSDNIKVVSSTYIKIASAYANLNQFDSCLVYIHLTEDYYHKKGTETNVLNDLPFGIDLVYAEYYARQHDFEKAIASIRKAEKHARSVHNVHGMVIANSYEAQYYFKQKEYRKAIACVTKMLPFYQKNGMLVQQSYAYKLIRNCYSELGEYKKASDASRQYMLIDDSVTKTTLKSQLSMIRSIDAVYESEAKLNETRKDLQIETAKNKMRIKQRNTFIVIAILSVLGVFISMGLFINSRNNKIKLLALHGQLLKQNKEIRKNSFELQRSNQLKDKLFSIIARDLRDPLNRLLVELAIVKKSVPEKYLTDPIENTLKETINLFEGLLEWSKTDQTQNIYSPMKVSLDENINKIILFYLPEIQAREIKIVNKSIARSTFADQNILQTLLRNLLSNAIASVSANGAKGSIEIETLETTDKRIEIVFSDSGPGFPEEIIEKFNSEAYEINIKSKGLGLSICKVLAKMSSWEIRISNNSKLNGAKVSIFVPFYFEDGEGDEVPASQKISRKALEQLLPLRTFKFYQTSQIRNSLKKLGNLQDPAALEWIALFEKSVHEGDRQRFESLLDLLTEDEA